jgi:hypothetical protein
MLHFLPMRAETPADKLRLAMAMQREGIEMKRRNLRLRHPDLPAEEIEALLEAWLVSREPDAPGRVVPWPRKRLGTARRTR